MELLYAPTSPFARKVRIVAHLGGLNSRLALRRVDPWADDGLWTLNPLGKVPTLMLDDGGVLFESSVICEYLMHLQGLALFPPPGPARWQALLRQGLADGVCAAAGRLYADERRPENERSSNVVNSTPYGATWTGRGGRLRLSTGPWRRFGTSPAGPTFDATGLPTRGIKELATDEPECQKLDRRDIHRLFKAAGRLILTETRRNQRPRRNRAILALLYYTGMRVSELVALRREQYDGRYLVNVKRKGKARSKSVYVAAECRKLIDEYLDKERAPDAPHSASGVLLVPNATAGETDRPLTRRAVGLILGDAARAIVLARLLGDVVAIHPHRLRHTFGAEYRGADGLGHRNRRRLGPQQAWTTSGATCARAAKSESVCSTPSDCLGAGRPGTGKRSGVRASLVAQRAGRPG